MTAEITRAVAHMLEDAGATLRRLDGASIGHVSHNFGFWVLKKSNEFLVGKVSLFYPSDAQISNRAMYTEYIISLLIGVAGKAST